MTAHQLVLRAPAGSCGGIHAGIRHYNPSHFDVPVISAEAEQPMDGRASKRCPCTAVRFAGPCLQLIAPECVRLKPPFPAVAPAWRWRGGSTSRLAVAHASARCSRARQLLWQSEPRASRDAIATKCGQAVQQGATRHGPTHTHTPTGRARACAGDAQGRCPRRPMGAGPRAWRSGGSQAAQGSAARQTHKPH